jgi:hypothetical protein
MMMENQIHRCEYQIKISSVMKFIRFEAFGNIAERHKNVIVLIREL